MSTNNKLPVSSLETEDDLNSLLQYYYENSEGEDIKHLRFGQWVYNQFNTEHGNSYNEVNDFRAYMMLLDYFMIKEQEGEK